MCEETALNFALAVLCQHPIFLQFATYACMVLRAQDQERRPPAGVLLKHQVRVIHSVSWSLTSISPPRWFFTPPRPRVVAQRT